jgi:MraZ protein
MAVFRGNHPAKVDPKGRLKLPAKFTELMDLTPDAQFYITSSDAKTAEVWPLAEWEKQEARLMARASNLNVPVRKYMNLTSYFGHQVGIDSEGRVLLPQILRQKAKLDAEVAVLGKIRYLEVHNLSELDQSVEENPMTEEERMAVDALLQDS